MTKATEQTTEQTVERRNFWRGVFHSPVRLSTAAGAAQVRLLDVSLKGALLDTGGAWQGQTGDECELTLDLALDVRIALKARVIHVDGARIGLRCLSIDLDSITHLRRLVELNSGDPEILERELGSLIAAAA